MEAGIDGFCHFWYDGIVGQHGVWTRYVSDPPWFMRNHYWLAV